jgi:hypothetical protein
MIGADTGTGTGAETVLEQEIAWRKKLMLAQDLV